jgi:hypothetical protein
MATDTKELKSLLHESIENIDDEEILHLAKDLLEGKYKPIPNIEISDYQKKRLSKAKESVKKGQVLTNEEADELVSKWINK